MIGLYVQTVRVATSVAPPVKVASSSTTTVMHETSVAPPVKVASSSTTTAMHETVRFVSFVASLLVNIASSVITAKCLTFGLAYGGILYYILILCKEFLDSNFIHWKVFLIFLICLLVILYWKEIMGLGIFVYILYCLHIHED